MSSAQRSLTWRLDRQRKARELVCMCECMRVCIISLVWDVCSRSCAPDSVLRRSSITSSADATEWLFRCSPSTPHFLFSSATPLHPTFGPRKYYIHILVLVLLTTRTISKYLDGTGKLLIRAHGSCRPRRLGIGPVGRPCSRATRTSRTPQLLFSYSQTRTPGMHDRRRGYIGWLFASFRLLRHEPSSAHLARCRHLQRWIRRRNI